MATVAYQGEPGAYSEEGAQALFPGAGHQPYPSIRTVFEAVEVGRQRIVDAGADPARGQVGAQGVPVRRANNI